MNAQRLVSAAREFGTPLAVVDEDIVDANLRRMSEFAAANGVHLRPHAKTHKSVEVARRQMSIGAVGLTVATLKEAETFAAAGVQDLLLAHPPVGEVKLRRLRTLAERIKRLAVALDDVSIVAALPETIEVMWEVDTGLHRVGTAPGAPTVDAVKALVRTIGQARFRGLITHGGHAYASRDDGQRAAAASDEVEGLLETASSLRSLGIELRELSIGSTPTVGVHSLDGITEVRPGTYVYGDANQVTLGSQRLDECALAVCALVVSTPAPDRAVIDAGSKALSADLRVPALPGFGIVLDRPHLTVARLSEEHAVLTSEGPTQLSIGDCVAILPAHVCTTVNLHGEMLIISARGSARWQQVDARGWR